VHAFKRAAGRASNPNLKGEGIVGEHSRDWETRTDEVKDFYGRRQRQRIGEVAEPNIVRQPAIDFRDETVELRKAKFRRGTTPSR
jgi:hypothetical protein